MEQDIGTTFLTQLLASPSGRQHMLSISVDAEEGDEGGIFDQLVDFIDEPKLRRIVERHRDDEVRHAALYRGCLDRLGMAKTEIPENQRIIFQIAETTGGFVEGVDSREGVVRAYAMLLAIEERGVAQFPKIAEAFRPHDPETADVYLRVARDERGHTRFCETVGWHYAEDDASWQQLVAEARAIEEQAFYEVGLATLTYSAEQGWVRLDELLDASTTASPA